MNISLIDKNLHVETSLSEPDIAWYPANELPFRLYGNCLTAGERLYKRLPSQVAKATNPGVEALYANTAGVRVRFATDSPYLAIKAEWSMLCRFSHMTICGTSGFDLYCCKDGRQQFCNIFVPPVDAATGYEALRYFHTKEVCDYVLNFPLYNNVDALYIGVKAGSVLTSPRESYFNDKPVVFYGSSITQGGCASRPGTCYQACISRALNMDYLNLGFSGSARGEKSIANYMAGLDMLAFVCDYDYNAPSVEHLEQTHYALYETIRCAHPSIPYVMISHPGTGLNLGDSERRRAIIQDSYRKALRAGDENVYFIDGDTFFPPDPLNCTVDALHPTDLGFYFMAHQIGDLLGKVL